MMRTINHTLPIDEFDASGFFSGKWYEQARTENRFQQGCVKSTAFYQETGKRVKITNTCYQVDGSVRDGPPMSAAARLFRPALATYNVFVTIIPGGVYNVLYAADVDGPAGVAIVAGKTFAKTWIMSRAETLSPVALISLKARVNDMQPGVVWDDASV